MASLVSVMKPQTALDLQICPSQSFLTRARGKVFHSCCIGVNIQNICSVQAVAFNLIHMYQHWWKKQRFLSYHSIGHNWQDKNPLKTIWHTVPFSWHPEPLKKNNSICIGSGFISITLVLVASKLNVIRRQHTAMKTRKCCIQQAFMVLGWKTSFHQMWVFFFLFFFFFFPTLFFRYSLVCTFSKQSFSKHRKTGYRGIRKLKRYSFSEEQHTGAVSRSPSWGQACIIGETFSCWWTDLLANQHLRYEVILFRLQSSTFNLRRNGFAQA